jgi:hypothetical protein
VPAAKRIPLGLGAASFAIAFLQRPGQATSDTKIDLHVDPAGFLADVASLWSGTGDLGHVQGGQYAGYLLPMGPFFALGDAVGLSAWVTHRLWLGLVLALAAWGMVRLLDELHSPERGVAHLVAGALIVLNPYVVTFSNRTSVTLLGYAALPWLLFATARGVRTGRGWWWPVFFAVVVALTGGGINAAVTAFALIGPVLLLVYMWRVLRAPGRSVAAFAWRAAAAVLATSLWWLVPVGLHAAYGLDFLPFTESPGAIWGTTSLSESLRLMGYWISYLGVGYGPAPVPYFTNVEPLLFSAPVVAATLLVPALALAGLVWTGRRSYAPFFVLMLLAGLVVMTLGFPEGTPLRRLVNGGYYELDPIQFLRTTYKAGPLVAVAVAWLAGAAAAAGWRRVRAPALRLTAAGAAAALVVLAAWPLAKGDAIDRLVAWDRIPGPWQDAARDIDRELPPATRAVVLPGQLYAFYDWGATIDPVLPALTDRPVAVAAVPPYSDLRAVDMLWTVDALVRQRRLVPGQLHPLLGLLGAGAVVTGTDDDRTRSGAPDPAAAAAVLRQQGLARPARSYGRPTRFEPPPEDATASVALPQVRRYDTGGARPIVRVEPPGGATVVDGSAEGLAALAAFGRLPRAAPIVYAADRRPAELWQDTARGGAFVVTDSNRKRVVVPSRPRQNVGETLAAADDPPDNAAVLDPFPDAGDDAKTLAVLEDARAVTAPLSPGFPQFPEHRPYAAVDGDPSTYWLADAQLRRHRHRLELTLDEPHNIRYVDLLPQRHGLTDVTAVSIGGRRFDVEPGWNRLPVRAGTTDALTVRITAVQRPAGFARGPGAIAELRIPGVRIRERLRPPTLIEDVMRTYRLDDVPLTYVFSRTSGDDPFRRSPEIVPARRGAALEDVPVEFGLVARPGDGERDMARTIAPPFAREYRVQAWLALAADAPDPALDRLAGTTGGVRFESSGRLHGLARHRASRAFDGDRATAWAMHVDPGSPQWLEWRGAPSARLRTLHLRGARGLPLPTSVDVGAAGRTIRGLRVTRGGTVRLPRPVNARSVRLAVRSAPADATVVAVGDVRGDGVPSAPRGGAGRARGRCGDVWIEADGRRLPLRPRGAVAALESGLPLRAHSCGGALSLPGGRQDLRTGGRAFAFEHLLLESRGSRVAAEDAGGRVLDLGSSGRSSYKDIRVALDGPAWLVLGQAYNRGWRAWCDDRSLGEPEPIDGYANGWRAPADCRDVRFDFGPQRFVTAGYIGSGVCLALALLLLLLTRPAAPRWQPGAELPRRPSTRRLGLAQAVVAALAVALLVAGMFGLRAGAVAFPILALVFLRGAGLPTLVPLAGVLLAVVVPLVYVLFPVENRDGFNPAYAVEKVEAHWVAVAAWVLLALALWRILSTASRRGAGAGRSGP